MPFYTSVLVATPGFVWLEDHLWQDLPVEDADWHHAMLGSLHDVLKRAVDSKLFSPDPLVSWKTTPSKEDFDRLFEQWIKKD